MKLILPVAGKSSRFPNMRPKWMLTHPFGSMMIVEAIKGIDLVNIEEVILIALKEHFELYGLSEDVLEKQIRSVIGNIKLTIVKLDTPTSSQPETIYEGLKALNVSGPIFIKDCDNYFKISPKPINSVAFSNLSDHTLINASNKSYISLDRLGSISNIVEKSIISKSFCVGGYGFEEAKTFMSEFERLQDLKDLYISHIIKVLLVQNIAFEAIHVEDYLDWGTLEEWKKFTSQYSTLFLDIDGVLVENSSEYFNPKWGTTKGLSKNIDIVNDIYDSGKSYIILTTSRKSEFSDITEKQLKENGVKYHKIIYDLPHAKRIVINDYSKTNPFKSCEAISLPRDSDNLEDYLAVIK